MENGRDPAKLQECFEQPALVAKAVLAIANHQLFSTDVLQRAIFELSPASTRLGLALAPLLLLLSPSDETRLTGMKLSLYLTSIDQR